jgi:hypothetical protein
MSAAQKLIAAAIASVSTGPQLPEGARRALEEIAAYNATAPRTHRVTRTAARKMLADEFGLVMGDSKFDKLVRLALGKGWQ